MSVRTYEVLPHGVGAGWIVRGPGVELVYDLHVHAHDVASALNEAFRRGVRSAKAAARRQSGKA